MRWLPAAASSVIAMYPKTLLPLLVLAVYSVGAVEYRRVQSSVAPSNAFVELPAAPFVVNLTAKTPRSTAKKQALHELRGKSFTGTVAGADGDEEYLTDITVGGQSFKAIVDTGR